MFKNILKSFIWLIFYFIVSIIGTISAMIVYIFKNIQLLSEIETNPEWFTKVLFSTAVPGLIIAAVITIIIFVLYKIIRKHPFDTPKVKPSIAIFSVFVGFSLNSVITLILGIISQFIPDTLVENLEQSTDLATSNELSLPLLIIGTGILVPIMEEIIFRYGMHKTLARSNVIIAYISSSLIFGIMHGNLIQCVYTTFLGIVLAYFLTKSENLWYPMIIHITINTTSVIISEVGEAGAILMLLIGIIGITSSIIMVRKNKEVRTIFQKEPKVTVEIVL